MTDAEERNRDAGDVSFERRNPWVGVEQCDGCGARRLTELRAQDAVANAALGDDERAGDVGQSVFGGGTSEADCAR